ncbi:response regulator [Acidisoma cellulosilytica]|uniref:Response regulator n=1 Tax=Acidisoma cellulosilyticum TaxID=2802395 RepID=A0A964E4R4_9PROT|nr:response regulator [Acidisoma cellulosilyticum]MCB8881729.1 response regulator [Acidisoma cellulosilyticum]
MSNLNILVVDDDEVTTLFSVRELEKEGWDVIGALSGDEAAEIIRSGVEIDLLITDYDMPPGIDGIVLSKIARKIHPGLPILMRSGEPYIETKMRDLTQRAVSCPTNDRKHADHILHVESQVSSYLPTTE